MTEVEDEDKVGEETDNDVLNGNEQVQDVMVEDLTDVFVLYCIVKPGAMPGFRFIDHAHERYGPKCA